MRVARVQAWLGERVPIAPLIEALRHKRVPQHRYSVWYYFGGITLFLFVVQVVTGGLLLLYYRPSAGEAYESVQFLMTRVQFGWLVRSIHAWSANLMVASAFGHLFSVLFLHGYRRPREVTWVSGAFLLFLVLAFGFTGYLLPWNQLSFFATSVGTDMAGTIPWIGHFIVRFLRGGDTVTGATLTRLFGVHVAILPAIATALVCLHLFLVQQHGMSVPPSIEEESRRSERPVATVPFFPDFALRDLFAWTVALAVLAALAAFYPWELGLKADPFAAAPAGIRPEWYFLWEFQTLKYVPASAFGINGELLVVGALGIGAALLLALPFLVPDRPSTRRALAWIAAAALAYMILLTALALRGSGGPIP
ncbi:MAG: cytochrome bc complex cytochrome b subunit [Acidobacteria bacterium RIFCSPLOWO2_12_FULL_66_21]|nr:MAG: cytochrome bc complex cytochrome b subunit [Acidobacteria bacterium RIFCSPLOWO2_12_FULL_66_21]